MNNARASRQEMLSLLAEGKTAEAYVFFSKYALYQKPFQKNMEDLAAFHVQRADAIYAEPYCLLRT